MLDRIIDVISESIASKKYDRKDNYENWRELEYYIRSFILFFIPMTIFIPISIKYNSVIELITLTLLMNIIRGFLPNTFHSESMSRCRLITILLVTPFLMLNHTLLTHIECFIIFAILTTTLTLNTLKTSVNEYIDSIINYYIVYNISIVIMLISYFIGFESVSNGVAMSILLVNISTWDKSVSVFKWFDKILDKYLK